MGTTDEQVKSRTVMVNYERRHIISYQGLAMEAEFRDRDDYNCLQLKFTLVSPCCAARMIQRKSQGAYRATCQTCKEKHPAIDTREHEYYVAYSGNRNKKAPADEALAELISEWSDWAAGDPLSGSILASVMNEYLASRIHLYYARGVIARMDVFAEPGTLEVDKLILGKR